MSNLDDLVHGYAFDDRMLAAVSADFDDADWRARPAEGANHAHWLLGHLAASRRDAARLLGGELDTAPWERHFGRGAGPGGPADDVPVELLRQAYVDAGRTLRDLVVGLSDEQLETKIGRPFPDGRDTWRGALYFLYMHEVYHIGQIGLIRRLRGKPGIA